MKIPIPDWFNGSRGQSLDELINSLPVLRDPEEPDNRAQQALVLPITFVDGTLHAKYLHHDQYVERPVSFHYTHDGIEHSFSLSREHRRIPARESTVLPLSVAGTIQVPQKLVRKFNGASELHPLGICVDGQNTLPVFLYDENRSNPELLLAEPSISSMPHPDRRELIEAAVDPILMAGDLSKPEFGTEFRAFYREMRRELTKPLTRRQSFASWIHMGAVAAGPIGALIYTSNFEMRKSLLEESDRDNSGSNYQDSVKKLNSIIIYAAKGTPFPRNLNALNNPDAPFFGAAIGTLMAALIVKRPNSDFTIPFYGLAGIASLTGRIMDVYSTVAFSKTMQDPRFKEYGFDQYMIERNGSLPQHPKPSDVLKLEQLTFQSAVVGLGMVSIPLGLSVGTMGAEAFFHNLRNDYTMRLCLDIGDQIKYRLARGHTDGQIVQYLASVRANGLEKANSLNPVASAVHGQGSTSRSPLVANYFRRFGINPKV